MCRYVVIACNLGQGEGRGVAGIRCLRASSFLLVHRRGRGSITGYKGAESVEEKDSAIGRGGAGRGMAFQYARSVTLPP